VPGRRSTGSALAFIGDHAFANSRASRCKCGAIAAERLGTTVAGDLAGAADPPDSNNHNTLMITTFPTHPNTHAFRWRIDHRSGLSLVKMTAVQVAVDN
jgi:hypothetical protein